MKKQIIIIAVSVLTALNSCTTSGSGSGTSVTPTPTSTFDITINGHSYHLSGQATNPTASSYLGIAGTTLGVSTIYEYSLTCNNALSGNTINVKIGGWKTDMSSATGNYYNGYDSSASGITWPGGSPGNNGSIQVVDIADGGKTYSNIMGVYAGQISTINVTVSNSTELKGTFNLNLSYNGAIYNITGDFDYNH